MNTICLSMIVKNESHIIEKTLENICNYINLSYWVISDTGSTDNTVELIEDFFRRKGIKGEISYDKWENFAHNRNLSLEKCLGKSDYILFFDADDYIQGDFKLPKILDKDAYYFQLKGENDAVSYQRTLLVKNNGNFSWRGVLHEFLEHKNPIVQGNILGNYAVISGRLGDRNKDPKQKYLNDATVLEKAILNKQDPDLLARYMFYCAQSYRDAGLFEKAAEWYLKRIEAGGWIEEVTCAYENLGKCYEELGEKQTALHYWLLGYDYNPNRAECLYNAVRLLRCDGKTRLGYQLGLIAKNMPYPKNDILFVKSDIYHYWIYYELSICTCYVGDFKLGYECCEKVLLTDPHNDIIVGTTINNLQFYKQEAGNFRENLAKVIGIIEDYLVRFPQSAESHKETLEYLRNISAH